MFWKFHFSIRKCCWEKFPNGFRKLCWLRQQSSFCSLYTGSCFVLWLLRVPFLPISLNIRKNTLPLPCFVTAFLVSCGIFLSSPSHKSILLSWCFLDCQRTCPWITEEVGKAYYPWQNFTKHGSNAKFTMKIHRREDPHRFLVLYQHKSNQIGG